MSSTIAAIATGPAPGGIGVVRISGPVAVAAARLVVADWPQTPEPRHAYFTRFVDGQRHVLDEGLALYFRAPASYTGEDVVELQAHGSLRLLSLLLERVLSHGEVRPAEAGEFTRRAFLSGRIDLARAEAVADVVAAASEAQVRSAAAQLTGALSQRLEAVRAPLLELRADLEGALEFPDDVELASDSVQQRLSSCCAQVDALLVDGQQGVLVRRGARVVLYGPVNAGKSTLFNRLLGAARALVDPEPGTTRDSLEARLELGGLDVTLVDTAGFRQAPGRLEALGIERTREALRGADIAVLVVPPDALEAEIRRWRSEASEATVLELAGKADARGAKPFGRLAVSGHTGVGVDSLKALLVERLGGTAPAVAVSSLRHLDALRRAKEALERALTAQRLSTLEVVSGELGLALDALADITGEDVSRELLDAVFARFCIGK